MLLALQMILEFQSLIFILAGGFALQTLVIVYLAYQFLFRSQRKAIEHLVTDLSEFLQKPWMNQVTDMVERTTRVHVETRESLADRLNQQFLNTQERLERTLAQNRQELQSGLLSTTQALETKFQSLEQQVGLRLESIGKNVESKLNENIKEGFKHFEKVQFHLQAAETKLAALHTVGQSISDLNNLLKMPHLRGSFGETTLERLLADYLPAGSFEMQYMIAPGSSERVDAVVKLARQVLPIDSKFPREQVLPLFESNDPGVLENARKSLSDFIKVQAKSIATKYIRPDCGTTDMALLFLPSETLYFEVIRNGNLFETLAQLKVFPVSPNTLAISLRSVTLAQEYYEMARGVEKTIEEVKKARRHFEYFGKKFEDVGKGLKKAQEAFDTAQTHLGHYGSSIYRLTGEVNLPEGSLHPDSSPGLSPPPN